MSKFSALDRNKPKNDPLYAAKFDDVNDDNYYERAMKHAETWDQVATLRENEDGFSHWMLYLERHAPNRRNKVLDAVAKRGYYSFPCRFPWDFDIRYTKDEDWL